MTLARCRLCKSEPYFRAARPDKRASAWCFGVDYGGTPGHEIEVHGKTDKQCIELWNRLNATEEAEAMGRG